MKKYLPAVLFLAVFETMAVTLWQAKDNLFYLLNFSYIGLPGPGQSSSPEVPLRPPGRAAPRGLLYAPLPGPYPPGEHADRGLLVLPLHRVFEGAAIHYTVAKLAGPLLFGRGWCGYACWTAMVLDFLPYPVPKGERRPWGWLRYVTFAASLAFVTALFLLPVHDREDIMFWAFLLGNLAYYAAGIALALKLRDNRAFCKYLCPVTVFLKPMSYFSLIRVKCDETKCVHCGRCRAVCPMGVDMTDPSRRRKNATECILCLECTRVCPKKAL